MRRLRLEVVGTVGWDWALSSWVSILFRSWQLNCLDTVLTQYFKYSVFTLHMLLDLELSIPRAWIVIMCYIGLQSWEFGVHSFGIVIMCYTWGDSVTLMDGLFQWRDIWSWILCKLRSLLQMEGCGLNSSCMKSRSLKMNFDMVHGLRKGRKVNLYSMT
jgi:hypothetical protein